MAEGGSHGRAVPDATVLVDRDLPVQAPVEEAQLVGGAGRRREELSPGDGAAVQAGFDPPLRHPDLDGDELCGRTTGAVVDPNRLVRLRRVHDEAWQDAVRAHRPDVVVVGELRLMVQHPLQALDGGSPAQSREFREMTQAEQPRVASNLEVLAAQPIERLDNLAIVVVLRAHVDDGVVDEPRLMERGRNLGKPVEPVHHHRVFVAEQEFEEVEDVRPVLRGELAQDLPQPLRPERLEQRIVLRRKRGDAPARQVVDRRHPAALDRYAVREHEDVLLPRLVHDRVHVHGNGSGLEMGLSEGRTKVERWRYRGWSSVSWLFFDSSRIAWLTKIRANPSGRRRLRAGSNRRISSSPFMCQ